jgi:hypothetical protein
VAKLITVIAILAAPALAGAPTRKLDNQLKQDFPNQTREVVRSFEINGVRVFHIKITGNKGESTVQITEEGDYLSRIVPTRYSGMPELAKSVLRATFSAQPTGSHFCESTTYAIDIGGSRPVRVEIDAAGRIQDILSGPQLRATYFNNYQPADRREASAVADKIESFFEYSKIKGIYHYPEAPGFFFAELTSDRGNRRAEIVMDTRKDVPFWRYELRQHELPKSVKRAMEHLVPGARIDRIMRVKQSWYRIEQPAGDDRLMVEIRPTGDVIRVRGELVEESIRERFGRRNYNHLGEEDDGPRGRGNRYGDGRY